MTGYNDDLVMSLAIGLWVRDTALRLKAEGIELQRKTLSGISSQMLPQKPTNENDSWDWEIGPDKKKESLDWLIK